MSEKLMTRKEWIKEISEEKLEYYMIDDKTAKMEAPTFVAILTSAFHEWMNEVPNCKEVTAMVETTEYLLTVQRKSGQSPVALCQSLSQKVKDLKKLLKDVLYYVQKLPQNELLRDMAYKAVGED